MDSKQLEEIKARAVAATPGPWGYTTDDDCDDYSSWQWPQDIVSKSVTFERYPVTYPGTMTPVVVASMAEARGIEVKQGFSNAEFIARAREDIPALLAEVERLQTIVKQLQQEINDNNDIGLPGLPPPVWFI